MEQIIRNENDEWGRDRKIIEKENNNDDRNVMEWETEKERVWELGGGRKGGRRGVA